MSSEAVSTLRMEIEAPPVGAPEPLGLLVPDPVDTAEQQFLRLEAASAWDLEGIPSLNSSQRAKWMRRIPAELTSLDFVFRPNQARARDHLFRRFDNRFTRAPQDLKSAVTVALCCVPEGVERLRRVVDFVAAQITYGPRNLDYETPKLACGMARGNCIDINTILLAACYVAGIEASYRAGFYFQRQQVGATADGMHCWISTRIDGTEQHWDIAHCQQSGLARVRPGLNPAGGLRMTMSYGRGLVFGLGGLTTEPISHFAKPHWVYENGSVAEAQVTVRLQAIEPLASLDSKVAS